MARRELLSCAVYVSSGARGLLASLAARASNVPRVAVVDTFADESYARSSLRICGEPRPLLEAARAVTAEVLERLDLTTAPTPAPHPRCGAVDMVAFCPREPPPHHRPSAHGRTELACGDMRARAQSHPRGRHQSSAS